MIIKQRYQEYDDKHISDPYPTIGFRAAGKWGEQASRFCMLFTLFGGGTVIFVFRDIIAQSFHISAGFNLFRILTEVFSLTQPLDGQTGYTRSKSQKI